MSKRYSLSLHIFRRDLRLQDNMALLDALASSDSVIACFIFDKRQIEENDYKSDHAIQFMIHSLSELDDALKEKQSKLYCFYGIAENVVKQLIDQLPIKAVFLNRDYTPFSKQRDSAIEQVCSQNGVDFHCLADALLHEPEEALKPNREPYTVYTPFYNRASLLSVAKPRRNTYSNYYQSAIALEDSKILPKLKQKSNPNLLVKGGRKEGVRLLKAIDHLKNYQTIRDYPAVYPSIWLWLHFL